MTHLAVEKPWHVFGRAAVSSGNKLVLTAVMFRQEAKLGLGCAWVVCGRTLSLHV